MTILKAFSVYDSKAQAYLTPFFYQREGEAVRAFKSAANTSGHQFKEHAADYTLFMVGEFNQDTGALKIAVPFSLGNALMVIDPPELLGAAEAVAAQLAQGNNLTPTKK